jgi:hypothetical protein
VRGKARSLTGHLGDWPGYQATHLVCPSRQSHLGWQPSRFLADWAEAERAFALAERLGNFNAAAAELGTTWPSLGKAFIRHGLGVPARNPDAVRQRRHRRRPPTHQPAPGRGSGVCGPQPRALPAGSGHRRSRMRGSATTRSTPSWAPTWWSNSTVKAGPQAHHPGLGDHPPGRPPAPAGQPTRQPARPPPRRPNRPVPPTPGARDDGRYPLTPTARPDRAVIQASAVHGLGGSGRPSWPSSPPTGMRPTMTWSGGYRPNTHWPVRAGGPGPPAGAPCDPGPGSRPSGPRRLRRSGRPMIPAQVASPSRSWLTAVWAVSF